MNFVFTLLPCRNTLVKLVKFGDSTVQIMDSEIRDIVANTPRWPNGQRLALCLKFNLESGEAAPMNPGGNPITST
jgi:hypothetical protein